MPTAAGASPAWGAAAAHCSGVLDGLFDPTAFGKHGAPTPIVSATRVSTGEARLFWGAEVTADVLLASACLPQLFPPVEIEGELY